MSSLEGRCEEGSDIFPGSAAGVRRLNWDPVYAAEMRITLLR